MKMATTSSALSQPYLSERGWGVGQVKVLHLSEQDEIMQMRRVQYWYLFKDHNVYWTLQLEQVWNHKLLAVV